ncbi:MAG: hypothetical protein ABSG15_12130, partial [FCB group bacterium]
MKAKYFLYSIILIFAFIFLPSINYSQNEKQLLTPEQMLSLQRVSEQRISPDGKWVLYTLTSPDIKANKSKKEIFAVSIIDGTKQIKVTDDSYSATNG